MYCIGTAEMYAQARQYRLLKAHPGALQLRYEELQRRFERSMRRIAAAFLPPGGCARPAGRRWAAASVPAAAGGAGGRLGGSIGRSCQALARRLFPGAAATSLPGPPPALGKPGPLPPTCARRQRQPRARSSGRSALRPRGVVGAGAALQQSHHCSQALAGGPPAAAGRAAGGAGDTEPPLRADAGKGIEGHEGEVVACIHAWAGPLGGRGS